MHSQNRRPVRLARSGRQVFILVTGVRIPYGVQSKHKIPPRTRGYFFMYISNEPNLFERAGYIHKKSDVHRGIVFAFVQPLPAGSSRGLGITEKRCKDIAMYDFRFAKGCSHHASIAAFITKALFFLAFVANSLSNPYI